MAMNPRFARAVKRFNPHVLAFARRVPPWVVIEHVGRSSGRTYRTPVVAFASRDPDSLGVLVAFPLPWGPDTDWARNVLRAKRFDLTRKGRQYTITSPRVVNAMEAARLAAGGPLTRLFHVRQLMVGSLTPASPAERAAAP